MSSVDQEVQRRQGLIIDGYKEVILLASIIKPDKFEMICDMATQIGVTKIIPIITQRVQRKELNRNRLAKIILESVRQSERLTIPILGDEIKLSAIAQLEVNRIYFANEMEESNIVSIHDPRRHPRAGGDPEQKEIDLPTNEAFWPRTPGSRVKKARDDISGEQLLNMNSFQDNSFAFLIGPEGGFTDEEILFLLTLPNIASVSLGANVLRSETAAIALLSNYFAQIYGFNIDPNG